MSEVRAGSSRSEYSASERLRAMLDEAGIKYTTDDSNDYEIVEWQGPYNLWWQFVYDPYEEEPYGELRLVETGGATHLTPEQAIAATVGNKPKDNPRNYNPDGTPKIPNMNVGADPDWVDWVASLEHKEPLDLKEAVEQFMFEVICFGGEMGPNDCGGEYCPDEGMVYTNDFINGWVNKITATVGAGTCHGEIDSDYFECKLTTFECHSCGWSGVIDNGYAGYSFGDTDMPRHCPNCGATVGEKQPRLDRPFIDNSATDKRFIWR